MDMKVIPERLNLRTAPGVNPAIRQLKRGETVRVTRPATTVGWVEVEVADPNNPNQTQNGMVSAEYLGAPTLDARDALVDAAVTEWRRFKCGKGLEYKDPYVGFVGEMWAAIGESYDGNDRNQPWSAAAISWIVRKASQNVPGLYDFPFHMGHWKYIKKAIEWRESGSQGPYWGRKLEEAPVAVGDLVVQERTDSNGAHGGREARSYAEARDLNGSFPSHCDLVIGLEGNTAIAIGGNLGQSVKLVAYDLTDDGHLKTTNRVYMFLQLQL